MPSECTRMCMHVWRVHRTDSAKKESTQHPTGLGVRGQEPAATHPAVPRATPRALCPATCLIHPVTGRPGWESSPAGHGGWPVAINHSLCMGMTRARRLRPAQPRGPVTFLPHSPHSRLSRTRLPDSRATSWGAARPGSSPADGTNKPTAWPPGSATSQPMPQFPLLAWPRLHAAGVRAELLLAPPTPSKRSPCHVAAHGVGAGLSARSSASALDGSKWGSEVGEVGEGGVCPTGVPTAAPGPSLPSLGVSCVPPGVGGRG